MPTAVEYVIELPLGDGERWFELARVLTPVGAAEVIQAVLAHDRGRVYQIRVTVRPFAQG